MLPHLAHLHVCTTTALVPAIGVAAATTQILLGS